MKLKLDDPYVMAGLAAVGGGLLYVFSQKRRNETVGETVADVFARGSQVTNSSLGINGVIIEEPEDLAEAAGVPADVYALARMVRSEGAAQGVARAHVALNDLRDLGWSSLVYLICYSTADWAEGKFGKQFSAQYRGKDGEPTWVRSFAETGADGRPIVIKKQTRRYSSARDPYQGDIALALKVMADHAAGVDPTGGAVKFLDKSAMGKQEGSGSFASVDEKWRSGGLVGYNVPQYGSDLVFYRRG